MSETYSPTGTNGSSLERFTSAEAATGTFGTMDRNNMTKIADKIRRFNDSGDLLYVGDTSNANNTAGLTINQGAADDEILSLKSSDVAHGVTTITETDTYGVFAKLNAPSGALIITGLADSGTQALFLRGVGPTDDTTKSTGGAAYVTIRASKVNGTGLTNAGANANLAAIEDNAGATRFIFDAEGDFHADSSSTTF